MGKNLETYYIESPEEVIVEVFIDEPEEILIERQELQKKAKEYGIMLKAQTMILKL